MLKRAMEIAEDNGFALDGAILDIKLDDGLDYPAASTFAKRKMPFLFLSGYDRKSVPDEFAEVTYLVKPCSDEELLLAVKALKDGRPKEAEKASRSVSASATP